MGREVRRVARDWQHPTIEDGRRNSFRPLYSGDRYEDQFAEWNKDVAERGLQGALEWNGGPPDRRDFMPAWKPEEATHFMMYETTSEGTPISPAFATPEELARWLADNKARTFGTMTATYEQWLPTCRGAWAPSMVSITNDDGSRSLESGVEFAAKAN